MRGGSKPFSFLAIKANRHPYLFTIRFVHEKLVDSRLPKWCYHLLTLRFCQVPFWNLYWHNTLKFYQYCYRNLDSSGVSKPSNSRSIEYTVRANGCLSNTSILEHGIYAWLLYEYLKMKGFQSYEKFCFLVPCRLTGFKQDIGVRQFNSNPFTKTYIVGISVWYQTLYAVWDI